MNTVQPNPSEATALPHEPILSAAQQQSFAENGYLVLHQIADPDALRRCRHIIADLIQRRVGLARGDLLDLGGDDGCLHQNNAVGPTLPQLLMPQHYAPELTTLSPAGVALTVARQLLGDNVIAEGEHSIVKPPYHGAKTPLHQDEAFWSDQTDYQSVSIWFPLQDVDEHNGCLEFVPGSHRAGIFGHHHANGRPGDNGLEVDSPQRFAALPQPLSLGDATVHHCRTLHGGGPNRTDGARYAYIFGFGLPATPALQPRNYTWLQEKDTLRERLAREQGYELTKMHPELGREASCS